MAPEIQLIGFEPLGSPTLYKALEQGKPVNLDSIETFVDGASMKKTGQIPFDILNELKFQINLVHEGLIAKTMLDMYDE